MIPDLRAVFDRLVRKVGAVPIVAGLALVTAGASAWMHASVPAECRSLPIRIIDLELTYSARRYAALVNYLDRRGCESAFLTTLVTSDVLFPIAYALLLCGLFLWAERQRRFNRDGSARLGTSRRNDLVILMPLAAGAIDILFENIPLFVAGKIITPATSPSPSGLVLALVMLGSIAASIKWTLVLLSIVAIIGEVLHGDRGCVIKRLRYSMLAVLLGALPLLIIPQGQDILQRTVEGDTPWPGVFRAVLAILIGGYIVWYCGRKLVQRMYPGDPENRGEDWYTFYARHIPRMLGISVILLGAAAFARAGATTPLFAGVAIAGYVVAAVIQRIGDGKVTRAIGKAVIFPKYRKVTAFAEAAGRAVIAILLSLPLVMIGPSAGDFTRLRRIAWALLVLSWLFYLFVSHRRGRIAARKLDEMKNHPETRYDLSNIIVEIEGDAVASTQSDILETTTRRVLIGGVVLSILALILLIFWPVPVGRSLGSLLVLAMGVASVVFYGSIATWIHERHGVPIAPIAIALAALFSVWNDSHIVRRLTGHQADVAARQTIAERYGVWKLDSASGAKNTVVLVAAAGGGLRAAYWTALSLARLQDAIPGFNRSVFAISGVSGGSVGASVYAALVHDSVTSRGEIPCLRNGRIDGHGEFAYCVREFMADDYLSPVLAKMIAPDFVQLFLPFPWTRLDRSLGLENSWEASYDSLTGKQTLDSGFLALYRDSVSRSAVPALFLNTTHVESGRRYVTAPLLRGDSTPPLEEQRFNFHDSEDLLRLIGSDLRLSTAAHNSARFSYVSPPGRIQRSDTLEFGHVVDGGYFENSGLATLREILEAIRERDQSAQFVVLYLCNDPVPCSGHADSTRLPTVSRSAVSEWLGPVRAVLSTRNARGSLSRSDIADLPGVTFKQLNVCDSLVTQAASSDTTNYTLGSAAREERGRERVVSPPLGWLLSRVAREWMDSSLTRGSPRTRPSRCRIENAAVIDSLALLLKRR